MDKPQKFLPLSKLALHRKRTASLPSVPKCNLSYLDSPPTLTAPCLPLPSTPPSLPHYPIACPERKVEQAQRIQSRKVCSFFYLAIPVTQTVEELHLLSSPLLCPLLYHSFLIMAGSSEIWRSDYFNARSSLQSDQNHDKCFFHCNDTSPCFSV